MLRFFSNPSSAAAAILALLIPLFGLAQGPPQVALSAIQVSYDSLLTVRGEGFASVAPVHLHVRRPGQKDAVTLDLVSDAQGRFSHDIAPWALKAGIRELWATGDDPGKQSNTVRFIVGFGPETLPEVRQWVASYTGVWRGDAGRNVPPVASPVLLTIRVVGSSVEGTVAYPALACVGRIGLHEVSSDSIVLTEAISFGADRCPSGSVRLRRVDDDLLFEWSRLPGEPASSGKLTLSKP